MVCIYCGADTRVANSRLQKRSNAVWRRRVCQDCEATVTTIEVVDLSTGISVLDGNNITPFSRDKLLISLFTSLQHREDAAESASLLVDTVIKQLLAEVQAASLDKIQILEKTKQVLRRFDHAAGTHYAAFHKPT